MFNSVAHSCSFQESQAQPSAQRIWRQKIRRLLRSLLLPRRHICLLSSHRQDEKNIQSVIDVLTRELGSHDYLIFRGEARTLLGKQVAKEDPIIEALIWQLYQDFATDMELGKLYDAGIAIYAAIAASQPLPTAIVQKIVIIESSLGCDTVEREISLSMTQNGANSTASTADCAGRMEALSSRKMMELTATFALPIALSDRSNLGVSSYNPDLHSNEIPTASLQTLDPQVEVVKDPTVEVEVKPTA